MEDSDSFVWGRGYRLDELRAAVLRARQQRADLDGELLSLIGEQLVLTHPGNAETEFALRFAQLSSPVMAKGVEDTAFYRYHRLVSLNEVGGEPGRRHPEDLGCDPT